MPADPGCYRPGPDPTRSCVCGIIKIYRAIRGIPAAQSQTGGTVSGGIRFQPYLPVPYGAKFTTLKNVAPKIIRESGVLNPVQKNRSHRHLSFHRFSPGLGMDYPGQQSKINIRSEE